MPSFKTVFGAYLKSEDIAGREVRVVIEEVQLEEIKTDQGKEKKLVAHFVGKEKGMILNRTNAESIAVLADDEDYENWAGTALTLYVDPTVKFGPKTIPALRIKAPGVKGTRAAQVELPPKRDREPGEDDVDPDPGF